MFGFGKSREQDVRLTEKEIKELKKNMSRSELKEFEKRQKRAESDCFWDADLKIDCEKAFFRIKIVAFTIIG